MKNWGLLVYDQFHVDSLKLYTEPLTHFWPEENSSSPWAPAELSCSAGSCLSPVHKHKTGSDGTLWHFRCFFGNFSLPCWGNGLQLIERKNLEYFWVDTFQILFLSSCAAKLSYANLREQNLRPGKNCFPMALFPKGMVPVKSHSQRSSDLQH